MIDDGAKWTGRPRFYSAITGEEGVGPANGWVILQDSLLIGDGLDSWALVGRIGSLVPGSQVPTARGFLMEGCGTYSYLNSKTNKLELGVIMNHPVTGKPFVIIRDNNTPAIRSIVDALAPAGNETMIVGSAYPSVPISTGINNAN